MMNYLSRIATRSEPGLSSLMPAISFAPPTLRDPFMQDLDTPLPNSSELQGNFSVQHEPDSGKSISPKVNDEIKPSTLKPESREPGSGYISRYIERTIVKEEHSQPLPPLAKKITVDNVTSETNPRQKDEHTGSVEKKPVELSPMPELPESKKPDRSDMLIQPKIPKLIPDQAHLTKPAIKAVKPEPKLVIGKITVEVLPPVNPKPTKIINRMVHVSQGNTSTNNKPSFGLGQL